MNLSTEYLAGILDGEGCIFVQRQEVVRALLPRYMLWVRINMCHEPFIRLLADELDASVIVHRKDLKNPKHRRAYEVSLHGKIAADFLRRVYPFLIIKQEEARLAIELHENVQTWRGHIQQLCHDDLAKLVSFREGIRLRLKDLKRQSFIGATDGMTANSGDLPCPAQPDLLSAEGQSRAKQELTTPGVCRDHVPSPKGKRWSELHGNMQSAAEMTAPRGPRLRAVE